MGCHTVRPWQGSPVMRTLGHPALSLRGPSQAEILPASFHTFADGIVGFGSQARDTIPAQHATRSLR